MSGYRLLLSSAACAAVLVAIAVPVPAQADVRAGTEAWARGDYAGAVKEWVGPAAQGDPDAQFNLAQAYKLGQGVPRDLPKAELLFGKAAAKGHVVAADNYGLLQFDRGERVGAMPYVRAAAARGDPRAQYLMGIAHFNGDLAPKDWVRAYALVTLAQTANLQQAAPALRQMDQFIPLPQRQAAATLAVQLAQQTAASRNTQLVAANLGRDTPAMPAPASSPTAVSPRISFPVASPDAAVSGAPRAAGSDSPATAGADYTRAAAAPQPAPAAKPGPAPAAKPGPATKLSAPPVIKPATAGSWRLQFGAFSVPANADALWDKLKARPEIAGHPRITVKAGNIIKLQAGGYASREAASAACATLSRSGITCISRQD